MPTLPLSIVDVFAESPLAGNQLAVIRDAASLSTETMQAVAREMNFSETTFVLEETPGAAKARIFTPAWELPFAGHPTLGTAWVVRTSAPALTLCLPAGQVEVTFAGDGRVWMVPPPVELGDAFPMDRAAALVGLSEGDLDAEYPCQLARVGPEFLLLGLRDRDALSRAALDGRLHAEYLSEGHPVRCVFLFTADAHHADAQFAARMFFESAGIREDPATGSANTAFAAYLRHRRGHLGAVVVDQGVEMQRPSRLYLDIGAVNRVAGRVQPVVTGEIRI